MAAELRHPRALAAVRKWFDNLPNWALIQPITEDPAPSLRLDAGERAAIALAKTLCADLLLMDDRNGVTAARELGLKTVGTIGILDRAARLGLLDLEAAISNLRETNFRGLPQLFDTLLQSHKIAKP